MGFDQLGKIVTVLAIFWGAVIFGLGFLLRGCAGI